MGRKICVCLSICELANAAQMRQIASQTAGPSAKRCGAWCCSRLASESVWGNADVHSADRGIAKRKFAWNVLLPKHCMPQPENHRPRKVPPDAPLAMGSVDGATKMAAPSTQPPSGRPSEQGRRGRSFSTCRLVAHCLHKAFALFSYTKLKYSEYLCTFITLT